METGRQLIRYVLPGGFALLLAVTFAAIYSLAWRVPISALIDVQGDPVTAVGGAVIVGFVNYQLYYAFYRPIVRLRLSPPGVPRRVYPIKIGDLGGAVLAKLNGDLSAEDAIKAVCGLKGELEERKGPFYSAEDLDSYVESLREHDYAMRTMLDITSDTGSPAIKRSYAELADVYHALGACRATLATTFCIVAADVWLKHLRQFELNEPRSINATLAAIGLTIGALYTIEVNRKDTRRTIIAQLGSNLRAWCLCNRPILDQLAGASIGDTGPAKDDAQSKATDQAT